MPRADELGRLEQEVGVLIRRVKRVIGERSRSVHPDLQPASYLMLSYLAAEGPQRSSVLSESGMVSASTPQTMPSWRRVRSS